MKLALRLKFGLGRERENFRLGATGVGKTLLAWTSSTGTR